MIGATLGPFHVVGKLGEGGMGQVYRATDTRLKRDVAIKVLPPAVAADCDRLARFQREAELLASLNHPQIAAIYGLEEKDGFKALVLELVEGPTLADRISEGPLPVDEALAIARQIALALEAAHERGIIHRDLKPANIKVRDDGTVKVLDFGLAKLTEVQGTNTAVRDDPSHSPTLTSPAAMTEMGMILGTATYMSPEQARGRTVDKRTDIWAFGAVLYEMLSGKRAFDGEDITDVIAAVVKTTPDWNALPSAVPAQAVTLIQRCLEKDRNARVGDIAVARFLLSEQLTIGEPSTSASPVPRTAVTSSRRPLPWVAAALLVGTGIGWLIPRRSADVLPVTHLQTSVQPADHLPGSIASVRPSRTAIAISPDGRHITFVATKGSTTQLFIRALNSAQAAAIPGTEGAGAPFFSPDGEWIGFRVDDRIKKVPLAGGQPITVVQVLNGGAAWSDDGAILLADADGISSVPSSGGTVSRLTTRDVSKRERHILPHPLPGGRALLFTNVAGDWDTASIVVHVRDSGENRGLVEGGADGRYVTTGHIVYLKSGSLMAVPFDVRSLRVTGTPVVLLENVMQAVNAPNSNDETGAGQFAVSASGTLVYVTGGISPLLKGSWEWVDRSGSAQPVTAVPAGPYLHPRLSPDGQKVAVTVRAPAPDLWVYDVERGAPMRLTFDGGNGPVWSPDGKRVAYAVRTDGVSNLYVINAEGGGKAERMVPSPYAQIPTSWIATPNVIAYLQRPQLGSYGIWVLPMDGARKPSLFIESRFSLSHAEFSPDGRWMAYVSRESGGTEVYVQPYPGPGEKVRISTAGGTEPIWTSDGRELIYRDEGQFFSAVVRSTSPFRIDTPRLLFKTQGEYDSTTPLRSWNVSADGKRFLLVRFVESTDKPVTSINVVLNWAQALSGLARSR